MIISIIAVAWGCLATVWWLWRYIGGLEGQPVWPDSVEAGAIIFLITLMFGGFVGRDIRPDAEPLIHATSPRLWAARTLFIAAGVFFLVQLGLLLNTSPEQEEAVGRAADLASAAGMTFLNVHVVVGYALTPRLLLAWRKPVDAADQSYPHR